MVSTREITSMFAFGVGAPSIIGHNKILHWAGNRRMWLNKVKEITGFSEFLKPMHWV